MMLGHFCTPAFNCQAPNRAIVQPDNTITFNGRQVGFYSDNEAPDQAGEIAAAVRQGWGLVVAAAAPYGPAPSYPGALTAREVYPFRSRRDPIGRLPRARAYISQWAFAWPGSPAPTRWQRNKLLAALMARRPRLILLY